MHNSDDFWETLRAKEAKAAVNTAKTAEEAQRKASRRAKAMKAKEAKAKAKKMQSSSETITKLSSLESPAIPMELFAWNRHAPRDTSAIAKETGFGDKPPHRVWVKGAEACSRTASVIANTRRPQALIHGKWPSSRHYEQRNSRKSLSTTLTSTRTR